MPLSSRLRRVYAQLKDDVAIPVLVVTQGPPTQDIVNRAEQVAGQRVVFESQLGNAVGMNLTKAEAERVANLPNVKSVELDEPVSALSSVQG